MQYKQIANITLTVVFLAFLGVLILSYYYGNLFSVRLARFVLEAALVGGVADWFAVTALFRKPLGFPYHTALIPRNREKVINAITVMVEQELLSLELLKQKLSELKLVDKIISWFQEQRQQAQLTLLSKHFTQNLMENLESAELTDKLEEQLKAYLRSLELVPLVKKLVIHQLQDEEWKTNLLTDLIERSARPTTRDKIFSFLSVRKGNLPKIVEFLLEKTNTLNLSEAADSLHVELIVTLQQIKADPEHPIRRELEAIPVKLMERLEERQVWLDTINTWQGAIIEQIRWQEILQPADFAEQLTSWVAEQIAKYLDSLPSNPVMYTLLEDILHESLGNIIQSEHHQVGKIVQETLEVLTDEKLNAFIEEKSGNDLQWIRVNGSMVGGIVGLCLFLFLNLLYEPTVLPVIKGWFVQ